MKKIAVLVCGCFTCLALAAQDYTALSRNEDGFTVVYKSQSIGTGYYAKTESRYGLIDKNKKIVLPLIYKSIYQSGIPDIYSVKDTLEKAALYQAPEQRFITQPEYYEIERFSDGLAVVKKRKDAYGFNWGAIDSKGNVVIPVEYDYLGALLEGLMNFRKDGKLGYMDRSGTVIIPPTYFNFAGFSDGLAAASPAEGGKYGYIDKQNNMVIPVKYEDANPFYKGYAVVARKKRTSAGSAGKPTITIPGEYFLIDKTGKEINSVPYESIGNRQSGGLFVVTNKSQSGAIDSTGKLILPVAYKDVQSDYNGNLIVRTADNKYGLVNNRGEFVMKPEYDYISGYSKDKMYYKQNGRYAVIDKKQKVLVPADSALTVSLGKDRILYIFNNKVNVFDNNGKLVKTYAQGNIRSFSSGFAANEDSLKISHDQIVEIINPATGAKKDLPGTEVGDFNEAGIFLLKNKGSRYDFYDATGKKLNSKEYFAAVNFSEGICALQENSSGPAYLADKNFKKIKDLSVRFIGPFSEGLAACSDPVAYRMVYLNKNGEEAFRVYGTEGGPCTNGRIWIKDNSGYFWVDRTGKKIGIKTWDAIGEYSEGFAAVKTAGKWGFIDTTGALVIATQFDEVSSFTKGAAVVKQNGKYKLINSKGQPIDNTLYEAAGTPAGGTFPMQKGGKVGLVDQQGATIISFKYENIMTLSEGRTWARKNGKWGLLDSKGKELTGFIYDNAGGFENGFAKVKIGDKLGLVNSSGKLVLSADYNNLGSVYKNSIVGIRASGVKMFPLR